MGGNTAINLGVFGVFVLITLYVVYRAGSRNATASDYYAAGSSFTGPQNGIALSGDFLSAASFLGISGSIAVNGYDGFLYSIGWVVSWLLGLMIIAERLRNTGRFTLGDVLAFRMRQRPVRAAAARTGRWRMRNAMTSPMVKRPVLRSRSEMSIRPLNQATTHPIEYMKPS